MKKIIALLLAFAAVFSLCACAGPDCASEETSEPTVTGNESTGQTESGGSTAGSEPTQPTDDGACVHLFSLEYMIEATCNQPGHTYAVCEYCAEERYDEIPVIPHSFADATCTAPATCSVCGVTEGEALGHSYVSGKCSLCGAAMPGYEETPGGCDHEYKLTSLIAATCTEKGSFTYTCSKCGASNVETIAANGHVYAGATCSSPAICGVCGSTSGSALGHSYVGGKCSRCGDADPDEDELPPVSVEVTFSVTVRNDKGKTVEGVTATVYVGDSSSPAGSAVTNSSGKATIQITTGSSYKVVLSDIPKGLEAKESYSFSSTTTNITLTTVPVYDPLDHSQAMYKVGDTMVDFTLTDIDGKSYTLSDLLEEKDAVVLNFWYCACNPCKAEFPYFNALYEKYGDRIELLAMTPYDTDSAIRVVQEDLELIFPVMRDTVNLNLGFSVSAYPTTVIITSDGVIRLIKSGGYTSEQQLLKAVEKYL